MGKISVVVNTLNEEDNLPRALNSVKKIADEIIVVDMESTDRTVEVARAYGAEVYKHKRTGYVEPARNFAIEKAAHDWILILDADEEIPETLAAKLKEITKTAQADYYRLPRKNINFGRWIKNSRWWPDYNIRYFKKGTVSWNEIIHSVPMTVGQGLDLPAEEKYAIIHYNYPTISKYIERMNRYTDIQAKILIDNKYKFKWNDLIQKPVGEFLSRYFVGEGFKDGLHGLALSTLQGFSELVLYLKIWQGDRFPPQAIPINEVSGEISKAKKLIDWWMIDTQVKDIGFFASLPKKLYRKFFLKHGE